MGDLTSTACYRELGAELRKIREAAGLTEAALSQELGWSTTKISRSERGYIRLSQVDVILYLAFCGIYGDHGAELQALCREAEPKPGHWIRRHEQGLPETTRSLIYHEATATASTSYEPELVPGLLQTDAYIRARAIERWPNWDADFAVRLRMERQRILHLPSPANFTFFVHENAMRLVVGDRAIMHEQILALLLLDGLPHVAIRIVPAEAGAQAMLGGPFRLFEYEGHQPMVYLDGPVCGFFLEDREYVDGYRALLPTVANLALNEGESRAWLAALASEYDRDGAHDRVAEEQLQRQPDE
jgi:transcriptional regulator with XRE-family HTH domain